MNPTMEHIPRFRTHPTQPKEYVALLTQRGIIVGKILWHVNHTRQRKELNAKSDTIYIDLMEKYHAKMNEIRAMEADEQFTGIPIDMYLNQQP